MTKGNSDDTRDLLDKIHALEAKLQEQQVKFLSEIKQNKKYYEDIIALVPGHLYWVDKNNVYLGCNDLQAKSIGLKSPQEIIGKKTSDLLSQAEADKLDAVNRTVMLTGVSHVVEEPSTYSFQKKLGIYFSQKVPLRNEQNEITGVLGISLDITKLKETEEALTVAKEKAEVAAEARANFLAMVSHELRTPLNAILGFGQELKRVKSPAKQREYINDILSGGRHLLALVNDILDFSKLESGKLDLLYEPFDLHECLDKTVHTLTHLIVDKPIKLEIKLFRDLPRFVSGDAMRLKQVVLNLLGNAIKFTHKGSIKLSAKPILQTKKKCTVRIEIEDTGIGIPEDKLKSIFEKFSQADISKTRKHSGIGLGLPTCKMLVEKMRGNISVESQEGKGSKFTAEIPFNSPGNFKV